MKWLTISLVVVSFQSLILAEGDNDKVGSSAFKFLNIQTDAHGAALGGLAAQASGANALFWNPASFYRPSPAITLQILPETTARRFFLWDDTPTLPEWSMALRLRRMC